MNPESSNPYQSPPEPIEPLAPPSLEKAPFTGRRLVIGMSLEAVLWWSLWAAASWNSRWFLLTLVAGFGIKEATDPSSWKWMMSDRSPKTMLTIAVSVVAIIALMVVFYILLPNMKSGALASFFRWPPAVAALWLISCLWMVRKWWKGRRHP